ncbi:MAG: RecX family transcriptional regulator [Bacteroidetes bacterium]|nr:RecX family transcriptional regulator [Bacteroidota bacterium]
MKKYISQQEALISLQKYCAYQERCHREVRTKLIALGIYGEALEEIICSLIDDDFLNELRFAKTYARGKFRMKAWGRIKIIQSLKQKGITDYCIKEAIKEINPDDYQASLKNILTQQLEKENDLLPFERKSKAYRYALSRGYESKLIEEFFSREMDLR